MKSMTGFGSSEFQNESFLLAIEIKSYNNRYLDIAFNAPSYLSLYEAAMKEMIKQVAARGHVEVNIRLKRFDSDVDIMVDESAVKKYLTAFNRIIEISGIHDVPRLTHFLHADDVLKMVRNQDASFYENILMEQLAIALEEFSHTKDREGEQTFKDIEQQLGQFEEQYSIVKQYAGMLEEKIQENLVSKFQQLLGDDYDESRILQEVAVMLMKYTVNEEISRIESHLIHFRADMVEDGPVGKRLDFLCQELNREINTIASKSVIGEVNQAVVYMKDSLENIREQLRNIE